MEAKGVTVREMLKNIKKMKKKKKTGREGEIVMSR